VPVLPMPALQWTITGGGWDESGTSLFFLILLIN
jgi:hypothetical protein